MISTLGRLERVSLRDVWRNEASDFTPWLAQAENIALLSETLDIELTVEAVERAVGPFRADILCRDVATNALVLIENQVERTDHTHLGQLITYAAGLETAIVVWIAERFMDDHRAALDWLNQIAGGRLRCFGLEVELWRIGSSPVAPKFNVVCQPNDWSSIVAANADLITTGDLSATKQCQLEFWVALAEHLCEKRCIVRPTKPLPQHWMTMALGRSGTNLTAAATTGAEGELRVEVQLTSENAKAWLRGLAAKRAEIEQAYGAPLQWHDPTGKNSCRIYDRFAFDVAKRDGWSDGIAWMAAHLERMRAVFEPLVRNLDPITSAQAEHGQ